MQFLAKAVDVYENSTITGCVGNRVRTAESGSPVRVLDCVVPITPTFNRIPGGGDPSLYQSHERLEWLHRNTLDLVQVGVPPDVGFALVPRHYLIDTPF